MSNKMRELEAKLTAQQRKAALMLVENELLETGEKRTQEDIAEEVGVSYKTIWSWRTQNRNFIAYKNEIADDFLSDKRDRVYGQLMKLINAPQPSVKAIDLFMRRHGLLTDRQVTETLDGASNRSDDDIAKEIAELDDLLKED
ncbi:MULTISPECIES: phBC6A51 family helix-turn-helix protein [Peribacillus]|uniref:phBC6A51 family helix-turn-helix protein n=1 Tax=Peribacillus TaxID=2675229 RepID=UPI002E21F993|nr:phBC6A51 family helix-turn-helix protein [Peribacillus frigoritolerans]MED3845536.1 phBC6A51 family helix-turn-helix protein [Peribacillus frigoritolerans]